MSDDPLVPPGHEEAIAAILKPTEGIREDNAHTRKMVRWAAFASIVAIIGVIGAIYSVIQSNQAREAGVRAQKAQLVYQANADYAARVAQCMTGNAFRTGDLNLWTEVLSLYTAPAMSPQDMALRQSNLAKFRAFLAVHDAQLDCSKIPAPSKTAANLPIHPIPTITPTSKSVPKPG